MTRLAQETAIYQLHLERQRVDPEDEMVAEDVRRSRAAMEVAWLDQLGEIK
jgi:hypothetical protein